MTYHTAESKAADVANDLRHKSTQSADRNEENVFMAVKTCIVVFLGYDVLSRRWLLMLL
jgi:hypothetical protein